MNERRLPGRPPKFEGARRPVTVTLPESTLQQLAAIHPDRARAIVKSAALATRAGSGKAPPVEVVEASPGLAIIVVGPSSSLRKLGWLRLVEIAPSRFLLLLPTGTALEALEVEVDDLREHLAPKEIYERELLNDLHHILRQRRRQQDVSKAELLLLRMGKAPPVRTGP